MRYIIYGAGAIGGVIGARLFQQGLEVALIARGPHLEAIREQGLRLEMPTESVTLPIPVVGQPGELEPRRDDLVILAMKTQDTGAALLQLQAWGGPRVRVLCAQNGVENERLALRHFEEVYGALVYMPASHLEPGVVQAFSSPISGVLDVGRAPRGSDPFIGAVAEDLGRAGFSARAVTDIMRWKYGKLLMNLGNAIEAACGQRTDSTGLELRLQEEALACYRAAGIVWATPEEVGERVRGLIRMRSIGGRERGGGSSWQSLARGTGTIESDYLNGEIALLGRLFAVPTPLNTGLQQVGRRMAREGRAPGSLTMEELSGQGGHGAMKRGEDGHEEDCHRMFAKGRE